MYEKLGYEHDKKKPAQKCIEMEIYGTKKKKRNKSDQMNQRYTIYMF